ncbi:MAG: guanylate kinase [Lachnospiraceae bacterium]|nr:guanylate kinase [Lachnospiraceae bacterium]
MGKIFCIMGKSATGKDTIYKSLLQNSELGLKKIVSYTTRPIREGEEEGVEYHFTDVQTLKLLEEQGKVIECRSYDTIYGIWYYFMVKDSQIDLTQNDYLIIGTLESYLKIRDYFGKEKVVPIYIELEDGERLTRALIREKTQREPKYEELCRRFLADCQDFSYEKLEKAGIGKYYANDDLESCIDEIKEQIISSRMV